MTRARGLWLGLGFVGVVLLVGFDTAVTLTLGVVFLLAFVAVGVALIATPAFIAEDGSPDPGTNAGGSAS